MNEADKLLLEWYEWWASNPQAPGKLPNALHVRTAVHLTSAYPDHRGVAETLGLTRSDGW